MATFGTKSDQKTRALVNRRTMMGALVAVGDDGKTPGVVVGMLTALAELLVEGGREPREVAALLRNVADAVTERPSRLPATWE